MLKNNTRDRKLGCEEQNNISSQNIDFRYVSTNSRGNFLIFEDVNGDVMCITVCNFGSFGRCINGSKSYKWA